MNRLNADSPIKKLGCGLDEIMNSKYSLITSIRGYLGIERYN
jgi:hypothetical protein